MPSTNHTAICPHAPPSWVRDDLGAPTGYGVRIGVIDSGWDRTQVVKQVFSGVGLVDPEDDLALRHTNDYHDRIGHGTACTDLILRIAPDVTIHPIRIFGERLETSMPTLRAALRWAVEQQLHVVNISLGTLRDDALRPLYAACEVARRQGLIIVAATRTGNTWSYPAVFDNVISVGIAGLDSPFSYLYRPGHSIECLAKGLEQRVRFLGGVETVVSGTSFAAPNITGLVALFLERYPRARLYDVRRLLAQYALPMDAYAAY